VASNLDVLYRGPGKVAVETLRDPARAQARSRGLTDLDNFLLIEAISRLAGANDTCAAFAMHVARRRFSHAFARSSRMPPITREQNVRKRPSYGRSLALG
jgi:hypothetical protein